MQAVTDIVLANPFWVWAAVGALMLAFEAATGTGWLLWPVGAAALTAVLAGLGLVPGPGAQILIFALVTIAASLSAKRFMPKAAEPGPDINDRAHDLVGRRGEVVTAFEDGWGRVAVDGAEWMAEADGPAPQAAGDPIAVTAVVGGARLRVRRL